MATTRFPRPDLARRRRFGRLALALLLLATAGCNALPALQVLPTAPPASGTVPAPTTVTFACYEYERTYYEGLAAEFHDAHPEMTVEIVSLGDPRAAVTSTVALASLAGAADTFVASSLMLAPGPEGEGPGAAALDLSGLLAQDEAVDTNDFYAAALSAMQREGGLWGLPLTLSLRVIFYNRALFQPLPTPTPLPTATPAVAPTATPTATPTPVPQPGTETATPAATATPAPTPTPDLRPFAPQPGWSWAEFVALAEAMTLRDGREVRRWGYVDAVPAYTLPVLAYQRAGPLTDPADPGHLDLARPEVAAAVQWYADLVLAHRVMPDPTTDVGGLGPGTYALEPGMWAGATFERDTFRQKYGDVGVVPFPEDGPAATDIVVRGAFISAAAADPQAAWQWIVFLTRRPPGPYNDSMPARKSVADSSRFWRRLDTETATAYAYALEHAVKLPPAAYGALYHAYAAVLRGVPAAEALAAAQARTP